MLLNYNCVQIVGTIANTVASVFLINAGFEIRIVKLASAVVFGITPIVLFYYVKHNYCLDKKLNRIILLLNRDGMLLHTK